MLYKGHSKLAEHDNWFRIMLGRVDGLCQGLERPEQEYQVSSTQVLMLS